MIERTSHKAIDFNTDSNSKLNGNLGRKNRRLTSETFACQLAFAAMLGLRLQDLYTGSANPQKPLKNHGFSGSILHRAFCHTGYVLNGYKPSRDGLYKRYVSNDLRLLTVSEHCLPNHLAA